FFQYICFFHFNEPPLPPGKVLPQGNFEYQPFSSDLSITGLKDIFIPQVRRTGTKGASYEAIELHIIFTSATSIFFKEYHSLSESFLPNQ
ncbi:MAG TPA: hypothetical protein VFM18_21685, partial [Methanosarcina sp.]|nr:hypothetical protein [Methanosarcina sp.]